MCKSLSNPSQEPISIKKWGKVSGSMKQRDPPIWFELTNLLCRYHHTLCRAIPQCSLETLGAWLVVNSVTRDSVFVIICMFNGLYPNLQCILNFISHVQVIFQSYITTCMGKTWSLAIYHILKRSLDKKYAILRTWCTTTLTAVLLQTLITQFRQLIKVGFPLVYSLPGDNLWIIWISQ